MDLFLNKSTKNNNLSAILGKIESTFAYNFR